MKDKCTNCIHLAVCGKYEYDEDRKECTDFSDENKVVKFEKYIGKKVKVLCEGFVANMPKHQIKALKNMEETEQRELIGKIYEIVKFDLKKQFIEATIKLLKEV